MRNLLIVLTLLASASSFADDGVHKGYVDLEDAENCRAQSKAVEDFYLSNGKNAVNFLAFGDPQIGYNKTRGLIDRFVSEQHAAALNEIEGKAWPLSFDLDEDKVVSNIRGVLIAGDLIEHGFSNDGEEEFDIFLDVYGLCGDKQLNYPAYEGYGNHDFTRGVGYDGYQHIISSVGLRNLYRQSMPEDKTTISEEDRAHYSWRWDDIHFVNLNLKAGNKEQGIGKKADYSRVRFKTPKKSLDFLIDDLERNVGSSGRAIVLMMHYPPKAEDKHYEEGELDAFYETIENYNIIAIVAGHSHSRKHYLWHGINVFEAGGPFVGTEEDRREGNYLLFKIKSTNDINIATLKVAGIRWGLKKQADGSEAFYVDMNKGKLGLSPNGEFDQETKTGYTKDILIFDPSKQGNFIE